MAKALSKSQVAEQLAERTGMKKKEAAEALEALAEISYQEAKNGFTFPGVGKLVVVDRKARKGRNPQTGEEIHIPAKRVLKFRIAKQAKDQILGAKR